MIFFSLKYKLDYADNCNNHTFSWCEYKRSHIYVWWLLVTMQVNK